MKYTLLIPTHCVKAGNSMVCSWAPSTKLIENTIESVFDKFFYDIKPEKIIIAHDYKTGMSICDDYHDNLEKLCTKNGFELQKNSVDDWKTNFIGSFTNNFINLYDGMETELGLLIEHDWNFVSNISAKHIRDMFLKVKKINHLRFSSVINDENSPNTRVQTRRHINYNFTENNKKFKILKTDVISNNPHVIRKSAYTNFLRRFMIMNVPRYGPVEGAIAGVFESMMELTNNDYDKVLDAFGYYIYGHLGDGPFVHHTDTYKFI